MKHILFLIVVCFLFSCNQTTETSGIKVKKTAVSTNGKPVSKNEFTYGETINIGFKNVTGLTLFEEKVYPKAIIYLLNENKDTVEITNYDFGEIPVSGKPIDLDINLLAVLTDATNKKSELKIKVMDTKSDNTYNYAMSFSIKPNDNFFVRADGINYSNIYLFNQTNETVITNNIVNSKEQFTVIYEGLNGFNVDKIGFTYPAASAKIVSANGTTLLEEKNLLKNYEALGFKSEKLVNELPVAINLSKINSTEPVKLSIDLFDLKSSNKLELETTLTLK